MAKSHSWNFTLPLIISFHIAKMFIKPSFSPKIAVIVSLLTVGSLVGLTYLTLFTFLTLYIYKQKFRKTLRVNMVKFLPILFLANVAVIIIEYLADSSLLIAAATTSLILQATVFIPLILSLIILTNLCKYNKENAYTIIKKAIVLVALKHFKKP